MTTQIFALTPEITIHNGKVVTTSQAVANYFSKQHKHVIAKIEKLDCSQTFTSANFSADAQIVTIGNGATRKSKFYQMTKDGFIFLVMGFTGKRAAAFKEAYVAEFNRMEAELYDTSRISKNNSKPTQIEIDCYHIQIFMKHFTVISDAWWHEIYPALVKLNSPLAYRLCDRFKDGMIFANFVNRSLKAQLPVGAIPRHN
ncbi:Rha family transcriptional regulator [Candidatus Fukatsuia symbiotica]|uniref:Rha family transcriptional regulator n=1 Tax=Candidatus Fukatsuia symbiotica TaxID=1878942 RepID=A0A2U8I7M9_9GAMM|nr:Rha family transcriptional regulator [Candidatus Fukatsuia symbiotica]AWK13934.1 hypothetical protein CCS41_04725 [Candidatus Fukatsuia symbiotica]MEA9445725.1 Rha family transcriptional regulator [Candidatus Fukatsuia symbiotica]